MVLVVQKWIYGKLIHNPPKLHLIPAQSLVNIDVQEQTVEITTQEIDIKVYAIKMVVILILTD